jgi:hypothetical protein
LFGGGGGGGGGRPPPPPTATPEILANRAAVSSQNSLHTAFTNKKKPDQWLLQTDLASFMRIEQSLTGSPLAN